MTRIANAVNELARQLDRVDTNKLRDRLLAAIELNETGQGHRRDGFPSGYVGAGGEDAPQSSTEGAALSNTDAERHARDQLAENVQHAVGYLDQAVKSLHALSSRLDLIDHDHKPEPRQDPSGGCQACDRYVAGTSVDRLKAGYCQACYKAWQRTADSNGNRMDRGEFEYRRHLEVANLTA